MSRLSQMQTGERGVDYMRIATTIDVPAYVLVST